MPCRNRGSRRIAVLIFNLGARWVWLVKATTRPLHARESVPVPTVQEAGWALVRVCTSVKMRKYLATAGVRTQNLPARSEWLHRLRPE
jgi:hypothetical protein